MRRLLVAAFILFYSVCHASTAPNAVLRIYTGASATGSSLIVADNANLSLGIGTTGNNSKLYIRGTGAELGLRIANTAGTDVLGILTNGNVGIGITNPVYQLQNTGTTSTDVLRVVTGLVLPNNSITNAMVSDTLTASDVVAGGSVISDAEVDDNITASSYQPLEATLSDIADGTIVENLVNTTNPWADNEVADDITLTNITQISTRSHTSLTDIGTTSHTNIDTHISNVGTTVHGLGTMSTQAASAVTITGGNVTLTGANLTILNVSGGSTLAATKLTVLTANTVNPTTLNVSGTGSVKSLRFGTLYDNILPAGTGSVNQVLKTGAAGVIDWQDDATGAGGGGISVSGPNYGLTYKLNSTSIVAYNLFVTDPATSYIAAGTQATGAVQFYIQGQDTYTQLFDVRGSDRKSWLDVTPGNVGIGATGVAISGLQVGSSSNAMALQVYGTITGAALRTTNYALPANTGAASQVLTTTGGAVVWATPSGGGSTSFESTVPNSILHVTGAGNTGAGTVLMVWDVTNKELAIGTADTSVSGTLYIKGTGTGFALRIANSSAQDKVVITAAGNVGIGTTAPVAALHIVGAGTGVGINTTRPVSALTIATTSSAPVQSLYIQSAGTGGLAAGVTFKSSGTESCYMLRVAGTGALSVVEVLCPS